MSDEQLVETVKVADEESDVEWAQRAPNMTPADLARKARTKTKPTVEESVARHAARHLWMRWNGEHTMLQVPGELPDVLGVKFEATVDELVEAMRPAPGSAWERRDRAADAMVERLRAGAEVEPVLLDARGAPVAVGRISSSLSPKILRAVLRRDGHCRCGQCDLRYGLHAHHLRPHSWGGTDEPSNLAMVASVHHPLVIPHGGGSARVGLPRRRGRRGAA